MMLFPDRTCLDRLALLIETEIYVKRSGTAFGQMLNQTATIIRGTKNANGDIDYGLTYIVPCRIDNIQKRVLGSRGESLTSAAQVYLEFSVNKHDKVCLPNGINRTPLQVNHLYDGFGTYHHCEVYI